MSPSFDRPLSAEDLALWDKACFASLAVRGLGHEALAQAVPLGWSGAAILAAIPFAALALPSARAGAARHLRDAFGRSSLGVLFFEQAKDAGPGLSWASRQAALGEAQSLSAFALFESEPLAEQFASVFGARYDPKAFRPHPR